MGKLKYLTTCACVDAMDRISSKVFIRLSYEYGICLLKRELIPSMMSVALKSLISNIGTLRDTSNDMAAYINLFDIITLGLVELNFDDTEKSTNILPDFRIGKRGCEACKMDYEKYNSKQVPIEKYNGRILNVTSDDMSNHTWSNLIRQMNEVIYANTNFNIDNYRVTAKILEIFLEEMFYDLGEHKGEKDYTYKLFDILYFNYIEELDMWGTDVMPEYKLMVKNDAYLEDMIRKSIDGDKDNKDDNMKKEIYWNK